jgi:DNA-binding transcriptional regulator YhcF (GntR family)
MSKKSARTERLSQWYEGLRYFHLYRTKDLPYRERLALSAVLSTKGAASAQRVSTLTGCDLRTVKTYLQSLVSSGLLSKSSNGYSAIEPPDPAAVFYLRKIEGKPEHWRDQLAYDRIYVLAEESSLTPAENMLLWVFVSCSRDGFAVEGESINGLVALTGISRRTVQRAMDKLQSLGFFETVSRGFFLIHPPDDKRRALFAPVERKASKVKEELAAHRLKCLNMILPDYSEEGRRSILDRYIEDFECEEHEISAIKVMDRFDIGIDDIYYIISVGRKFANRNKFIRLFNRAMESPNPVPLMKKMFRDYFKGS